MKKTGYRKYISRVALAAMLAGSAALASNAQAMNGSIQALGSWWEAGDSGSTYGVGLRGSLGVMDALAVDLGWIYFSEGDDITLNFPDDRTKTLNIGGIDANVFDLGMRYTFPAEIYLGGGLSYYDFGHDVGSIDGEWGLYGLLGWSFGGENIRGFIEGMYRYTEGTIQYDNGFEGRVERDVEHDGFGANIGIMYRF